MKSKQRFVWKIGDIIPIIQDVCEVRGILGEGGMGVVYKVHLRYWNNVLAVKSPKPDVFTKAGGKESFMREAETWVNLNDHPHIVRCAFVQMVDDIPRIFVEYIDGGSLADWIRRQTLYQGGTARALERMLDIAIQCAWGLHAAHEQGLVHQDVKPANVMMTSWGIAKVTDFGLAKARVRASEQGEQRETEGLESILVSSRGMTPAYCSPEQAAGRPLSRKTDIWSWGVLVLEMFVGEVTWQSGIQAREVLASHKPQDEAIPPIPTELVKLLARCFAWRAEERPATLLEVATDVQVIYAHLEGHPYPREMPPPAKIQAGRLNNQGFSLGKLGRREEAVLAYEQAISLAPTHVDAHYNKGNVLYKLGRPEEAVLAYEQAIRLDPTDATAHYNKGFVLKQMGQTTEAELAFQKARDIQPGI
ncbi:protein kinase domain-containing protein [Ktedonobacter racemifer]|uniref:Serine/threonine protein kinase with TPR repeats n=1 Tax=Ktedonobacter racemifer DSM 44963 TaxID=485913 RepID=D6U029_KTERA|nr:serine/threonine-protein kinase [Ktedonobacter racemifer]EFH82169.1 serine/threonine protein kinase with TPR repeats [Ktedonobacter racemifer DSM 44963]